MSKAYDHVEWHLVEQTMLKMGFTVEWVALMMRCVCSVSYSVVLNGDAREHISPSRGLR